MRHKGIVVITLLSLLLSFGVAQAQTPEIINGVNYLTATQNADGSWGSVSSSTDALTATAEGVEALKDLGLTNGVSYASASTWLSSQNIFPTGLLSQRILALSSSGSDTQTLSSYMDTLSGAWGGYEGYDINMLDTALAMRALESAGAIDTGTLTTVMSYISTSQNADGGWGFVAGGPSSTYVTSLVMEALRPYGNSVETANALEKAKGYLLAHQNTDGGFGDSPSTVYETASAYLALVGQTTDETVLGNAVNYLKAVQGTDGSWVDDPWQTALALEALVYDEYNSAKAGEPVVVNSPAPAGAVDITLSAPLQADTSTTLTGTVVDEATGTAIPGALVAVIESQAQAYTDGNGAFSISGIGLQGFTLSVSAPGYRTRTYSISTGAFGTYTVELTLSPDTLTTIRGTVTDKVTGEPLAGGIVSLVGQNVSVWTQADGSYELDGIEGAQFNISASAHGYNTAVYQVSTTAPGEYRVDIQLAKSLLNQLQIAYLLTDKDSYGADENVTIDAYVENQSNVTVEGSVVGEVVAADGTVVAQAAPTDGQIELAPSLGYEPSFSWNTMQVPAGEYMLVLKVIAPGSSGYGSTEGFVLAERSVPFTIVPTKKLSGAIAMTPPLVQADNKTPVDVTATVRNTGNTAISTTLVLQVSGDSGVAYTSSYDVSSLGVNKVLSIDLGSFIPPAGGKYTVTLSPEDSTIVSDISTTFYVGETVSADFTVKPDTVPPGDAHVKAKIVVTGGNADGSALDPMVPVMKDAMQRAVNYEEQEAVAWHVKYICNGCHVQSQALVGLAHASQYVKTDPFVTNYFYGVFKKWQNSYGTISPDTWTGGDSTALALWAFSAWPDQEDAKPYLIKMADSFYPPAYQGTHYWYSTYSAIRWWAGTSITPVVVAGVSHAYKLTGDSKYTVTVQKALLCYYYKYLKIKTDNNKDNALNLWMLVSAKEAGINDTLRAYADTNIPSLVSSLKLAQNADGGWGETSDYDSDSMVTAMALYALLQADVPANDPVIKDAIVFLMNNQDADGSWESQNKIMNTRYAATSWVLIALPVAFEKTAGITGEVHLTLPDNNKITASSMPYYRVGDTNEYVWEVNGINSNGREIDIDMDLQGLQLGDERALAGAGTVQFRNSFTGDTVEVPLDIPSVKCVDPLKVDVSTDKPEYTANEDVGVNVDIHNISTQRASGEVQVSMRDAGGNVIHDFGSYDITNLKPAGLSEWTYRIPVNVSYSQTIKNKVAEVKIDFDQILQSLGLAGESLDSNSLRVLESDAQGNIYGNVPVKVELDGSKASLAWMVDSIGVGDVKHYFIYFDVSSNGPKPEATEQPLFDSKDAVAYADGLGNVYIVWSNGDGTFSKPTYLGDMTPDPDRTMGVTVGDFNNDGFLDVASAANFNGGTVYLFQNKADGSDTFSPRVRVGGFPGYYVSDMTEGDYNNDGLQDFVVSADSNNLNVFMNNGDGTFTRKDTQQFWSAYGLRGRDTADVDGDGDLDIVVGSHYGDIYLLRNDGEGNFTGSKIGSVMNAYGLVAGDFDEDGNVDIIAQKAWIDEYKPYFLKGKGDGSFEAGVYVPTLDIFPAISTYDSGDLNGDGHLDIVMMANSGNEVYFVPGNGDGTFGAPTVIGEAASPPWGIAVSQRPHLNSVLGEAEDVPAVNLDLKWNTGTMLAGTYQVHVSQVQNGEVLGEYTKDFTILPDAGASSRIFTDKASYGANEDVAVSSSVTNEGSNALLEGLTARILVKDGDNVLYTEDHAIDMLVPGQTTDFKTYWNMAEHGKGTYTAVIEVLKGTEVLSTSSVPFEILGSESTGEGLRGSITASPNVVHRGKDETLQYSVENQGNEDMTGLAIKVIVVDPKTKEAVATFENAVALAQGSTTVDSFTEDTSALKGGFYIAVLEAQTAEMANPKTLAQDTFKVLAPSVEATEAFGTRQPHVLVWLNYDWTSSSAQQARPDLALVEQALQAAGVSYVIVYHKKDFQSELRSPFYTDYLILGNHLPLEDHYAASLREKVFSGRGLISSMFNRENLNSPVFGVKVTGYLNHGDYPVELDQSDISDAVSLQSAGRSLKAQAQDESQVMAWVLQDTNKGTAEYPGIVERSYGFGNVLFYAFDLGLSTGNYAQFESLIVNSLAYVHKPGDTSGSFHAYELVPVDLVLKSTGDNLNVQVEEQYPDTFRLFDPASWSWVTDNPWVLDVFVSEGQESTVDYYALTPDQSGTFTLTSKIGIVEGEKYTFVLDKDIDIPVKDTYTLTGETLEAVQALTVSPEDETLVADAATLIQGTQSRVVVTADDVEANIHDILQAIEDLLAVTSADTSDANHLLDGVLNAWEGRAYFGMM